MNETALRARYATFIWCSVIAAGFTLTVGTLMLANLVRRVPDPLTAPAFVKLKEELRATPDSEELKNRIRELDLALRDDYFRRRQFTDLGILLMLGGVIVSIGAAKAASRLQRRLPHPDPQEDWGDREGRIGRQSIAAVLALTAVGMAGVFAADVHFRRSATANLPRVALNAPQKAEAAKEAAHPPTPKPEAPRSEAPKTEAPEPPEPAPAATPAKLDATAAMPTNPKPQPTADAKAVWPQFRGPGGAGISTSKTMPTVWDASGKGVVWKSPVPLPGYGSPVVWNDSVFLTGADEAQREIYCFDSNDGKMRWKWTHPAAADPAAEPLEVTEDTGYAASTAATDGQRIFAIFATGDLGAVDFSGKQVWVRSFGYPKNTYGHASSLVVAGGKLVVQLDQGNKTQKLSRLMALDPESGKSVWETVREVPNSWSTPAVVEREGQTHIITCGDPWVIAYQLQDGKEVWRVKCLRQDVGPSPVSSGDLLFAANEFPGISAIRLGGQGDVTDKNVAWFADMGAPDTCSPLVVGDMLLVLASFGTLTCYDAAKGGDPLWEEEFDENFRSSPGLAGEHVYLFSETGKSWVVKPSREKCERVAENDLGEGCVTSPAFVEGRFYIRGNEHLFCVGKKS